MAAPFAAATSEAPASDTAVRVDLVGVPRVRRGSVEVRLPVKKSLALLAYLSLAGPATRAVLADLLWRDLDDATARRNLRRALHRLRAAGLGEAIHADDDDVALGPVDGDVGEFRRAASQGDLAVACRVGDAPLCGGLDLGDEAPGFDAWLQAQREAFARERRDALERRAGELELAGDFRGALALQQRLLADDPMREATYRELMRLHDALGEREPALDLYARCELTLRNELRLEPLPQTRLLAERIRNGLGARTSSQAPAVAATLTTLVSAEAPFVARERELAAISSASEAVVVVEGDAGVGKTRLALEAARRHGRGGGATRDAQIAVVRFSEPAAAMPFEAVADALRGFDAGGRLASLDVATRSELSPLVPSWRPAAEGATTMEMTPAELRARLITASVDALMLAAEPARVLVFDDLQWADASSLELLDELAARRRRDPEPRPLRILATARSAELEVNTIAADMLAALARRGDLARVVVAPFDDWSMLQLVQRVSRSEGGVRFAARLVTATGGNAFFALETIRALIESGELRVEPGTGWSTRYDNTTVDYAELPLPETVVAAVRARIAGLGATAQRVLDTAALADDGSSLDELREATALSESEALEGIERALAAHVVERIGGGFRFSHDLFRSALRTGLSPERQALIHGRLAQALEPMQAAPARIARHWQHAGRSDPACRAWIRAAEAAGAVHAHREAIDHYGRAAALARSAEERLELLDLRLVRIMMSQGMAAQDTALAALVAAAEASGSSPLMFRALLRAAEIAYNDRRPADCERLALRALREFEPPDSRRHLAALITAASAASDQIGRLDESLARWLQALEVAERREPRSVAFAASSAAAVAVDLDRLDLAEALRQKALAALVIQETTPSDNRAQALSRCSFVLRARGDRALAFEESAQALTIARRIHFAMSEAIYLANQCETLVDDGRLAEAQALHAECRASFADPAAPIARFVGAMTAIGLHLLAGELGQAIASARAAIVAGDELGGAGDRRESRLLLASLLAAIGVAAEPMRLVEEALAIEPIPAGVLLLPVENLRASAQLERDPRAAKERLVAALARPFADRLLHPHVAAARVLLGRCELAIGDADAARAAVQGLRYSVAVETEALAVRVQASGLDGARDASADEASAWLDRTGLAPVSAIVLLRALAARPASRVVVAARKRRLQSLAQALADSLRAEPPLQGAFIRTHRDLLT